MRQPYSRVCSKRLFSTQMTTLPCAAEWFYWPVDDPTGPRVGGLRKHLLSILCQVAGNIKGKQTVREENSKVKLNQSLSKVFSEKEANNRDGRKWLGYPQIKKSLLTSQTTSRNSSSTERNTLPYHFFPVVGRRPLSC